MNYDELELKLKTMQPRTKLYELVKAEMIARDRWKTAPRGKGFNKGEDERRKRLQAVEN